MIDRLEADAETKNLILKISGGDLMLYQYQRLLEEDI